MKKLIETLLSPFVALKVHIGTSREINEDGSYDRYWARMNAKEMRKNGKEI